MFEKSHNAVNLTNSSKISLFKTKMKTAQIVGFMSEKTKKKIFNKVRTEDEIKRDVENEVYDEIQLIPNNFLFDFTYPGYFYF